jgi:hypothetical protein
MPRPTAALLAEQSRLAHCLADAFAVSDIEDNAYPVEIDGETWLDVRPMLDTTRQAAELVEIAKQSVAYARLRGLTAQHEEHTHLVRLQLGR